MKEIKGWRELFEQKLELAAGAFGVVLFVALIIPYATILLGIVTEEMLYGLMNTAPLLNLIFWAAVIVWGFLQMPGTLLGALLMAENPWAWMFTSSLLSAAFWALLVYLVVGLPIRLKARRALTKKTK